jgi:hypothetical protein
VQVFAFVCVGAVEGNFLGSPIGSKTLVITGRNTYLYCTTSPLLFGEIPTQFTSSRKNFWHHCRGDIIKLLSGSYIQTIIYFLYFLFAFLFALLFASIFHLAALL